MYHTERSVVSILIVLVMVSVFAAGGLLSVLPAQAQGPVGQDWAGAWQIENGTVRLWVDGLSVAGAYNNEGNRGFLTGRLSEDGRTLEGHWVRGNLENKGRFSFSLSDDDQSWSGTWGLDDSASDGGTWTGTRITPTPPPASTWNGEWVLPDGLVTLQVQDGQVTGSYTRNDNTGTLTGALSPEGRALEGSWSNDSAGDSGRFILKLAEDGHSWTGAFGQEDSALDLGTITAVRKASGWDGEWITQWGKLALTVNGSQATGTYDYEDGRIEGMLSPDGRVLKGTWSEAPSHEPPSDGGKFIFQLTEDGLGWTGVWGYGDNEMGGTWWGRRPDVASEESPSIAEPQAGTPAP